MVMRPIDLRNYCMDYDPRNGSLETSDAGEALMEIDEQWESLSRKLRTMLMSVCDERDELSRQNNELEARLMGIEYVKGTVDEAAVKAMGRMMEAVAEHAALEKMWPLLGDQNSPVTDENELFEEQDAAAGRIHAAYRDYMEAVQGKLPHRPTCLTWEKD